jgi:hypothetical protein
MDARITLLLCQRELINQAKEKGKEHMVLDQEIKPVKEKKLLREGELRIENKSHFDLQLNLISC